MNRILATVKIRRNPLRHLTDYTPIDNRFGFSDISFQRFSPFCIDIERIQKIKTPGTAEKKALENNNTKGYIFQVKNFKCDDCGYSCYLKTGNLSFCS